jgi:hypothetical protein
LKPKKRDNKEDMADAIFLAQKKRGELEDDDYDEGTDGHNTHRVCILFTNFTDKTNVFNSLFRVKPWFHKTNLNLHSK